METENAIMRSNAKGAALKGKIYEKTSLVSDWGRKSLKISLTECHL